MKKKDENIPSEYGTITVKSMDELEGIMERFGGQMISPGGAARFLRVSRAYIHQLEKANRIRAYRIVDEHIAWDRLPMWAKLLATVRGAYIYIPMEDLEAVKAEMIAKAEAKLRKFKDE